MIRKLLAATAAASALFVGLTLLLAGPASASTRHHWTPGYRQAGVTRLSGGPHTVDHAFTIATAYPTRGAAYSVTVTITCSSEQAAADPFRGYSDLLWRSAVHSTWPAGEVASSGTTRYTVSMPATPEKLRFQAGCDWTITASGATMITA